MWRIAISLLLVAALSACALPVERPGRWGMAWGRSDTAEEGAKLVLGREGTDDVRLMMTCQPHSGLILFTAVGGDQPPAVIELHSGKLSNHYAGAGYADEGIGASTVVKIAADDPVLQAFADTGQLTIIFDQRRIVTPNGFAPGHDFLRICQHR
jgi:hypothetical protein